MIAGFLLFCACVSSPATDVLMTVSRGGTVETNRIASAVTLTGYANGAEVVVNYTDKVYTHQGREVPPMSWVRFD